jgi:hypothetical protein
MKKGQNLNACVNILGGIRQEKLMASYFQNTTHITCAINAEVELSESLIELKDYETRNFIRTSSNVERNAIFPIFILHFTSADEIE